jgi:hypothetical protein
MASSLLTKIQTSNTIQYTRVKAKKIIKGLKATSMIKAPSFILYINGFKGEVKS